MSQTHTFGKLHFESYEHGVHGYSHEIRSEDGTNICELFGLNHTSRANAERIVLCCNAHDDLVAALRALLENNLGPQVDDGAEWDACCDMAKAALAKAGEK